MRVRRQLVRTHEALLRRQVARAPVRHLAEVVSAARGPQADALARRLAAVLHALGRPVPPSAGAAALATDVEAALAAADRATTWMALAVLTARLPLEREVVDVHRALQLDGPGRALGAPVAAATSVLSHDRWRPSDVEVRQGVVVVDVDFTAKHDVQTGIQRVVRRLLPLWHAQHPVAPLVWTERDDALRDLDQHEQERVLRWTAPLGEVAPTERQPLVVVPWRSTVVLPEVPGHAQCTRLAALAAHSGNRVVVVGYDCIPVLGAEFVPETLPSHFAQYLRVVKHAERVATISASAAREFGGVAQALSAQGLPGPGVTVVPLATEVPLPADGDVRPPDGVAEVLVVGSHEPRKNHLAVLHAAEGLWRDGLRFRLRLLGGRGFDTATFERVLDELTAAGRPVDVVRQPDDQTLWEAFQRARFTVFPSLYEGYGLPVVESLALGTPVVTTGYGSTAELAGDGGVLLVDPRDDGALADALRRLLTDDHLLARLCDEAARRPVRTWTQYADELWVALVG